MSIKTMLSIVLCIFINIAICDAQRAPVSNITDRTVYESLLTSIDSFEKLPIYYQSDVYLLKTIDFKKIADYKWISYGSSEDGWIQFIANISDISTLKSKQLFLNLENHPITKQKIGIGISTMKPYLTLSPIIYSSDNKLALCDIEYWGGIENTMDTLYLLELRDGRWVLIKSTVVGFS